ARRVKREFERAVELDVTLIAPREGLVTFYSVAPGIMGGSMDKAREQANEILKLNPLRGHWQLAQLAERQKDTVAAEHEYKTAVSAAPDSAAGYYQLANYYRRLRRWDDARSTYEHLMATMPSEVTAHLGWGAVAVLSGKDLERAEREIKLYLANLPADAATANVSGAHYRLGQIYEKSGRKEPARTEYNEAIKANPRN